MKFISLHKGIFPVLLVTEFAVNFGQNRVSLTIEFSEIEKVFNYLLRDEVRLIWIAFY